MHPPRQRYGDATRSNAFLFTSEIEDCTSEWTFAEETFDYVHARWLIGAIPDWNALYKEAYKSLKPGGWVETHEPSADLVSEDGSITPDTAFAQWEPIFLEGGRKVGRTCDILRTQLQRKGLEEAGFVDIQEIDMRVSLDQTALYRAVFRATG